MSNTTKGMTNKRQVTFRVNDLRSQVIESEQIGLGSNSKYQVRTYAEVRQSRYGTPNAEDMVTTEYEKREDAVDYFRRVCVATRRALDYVPGTVRDTQRPVCDDPSHRDYAAANFIRVSHNGSQAGRCFYISDTVYARADGAPLTQADLDHLRAFRRGQVHTVTGEPGDLEVKVHTECDSGD